MSPPSQIQRDAERFVAERTEEIRPLERDVGLALWEASLSGAAEDFDRVAELEKREVDLFSRADEYEAAAALREGAGDIADPLLARAVEILHRNYRRCQGDAGLLKRIVELEAELAREYNTFRAEHRGERRTNNYLEEILKNTGDSAEAREAWEALKQVGETAAPRIVELAGLRNRHARSLGSRDYHVFSLELNELRQDKLFATLGELERETDALFGELKSDLDDRLAGEFGVGAGELRPWHYRNPFFQEMPAAGAVNLDGVFADKDLEALTVDYYAGIGLDVAPILARSDLYEKEGKDQHAFCIGIDNPWDVRVLCNVQPTSRWMSTMLHEFGHAIYDAMVREDLPYFLRGPAHTLTTEAVAMLNERFMQSADFLSEIAGVERGEAERLEADLARHQRHKLLVFTRWVLVMTHFERALYEDPERDLCALWWDLVGRFQGLDGSERRGRPDWAAKIHLATAPVYYQNYLLGEMNASQILAALRREAGSKAVGNPAVGAFLERRLFRPGASKPWNERLAEVAGEALDARFFLEDLKGDGAGSEGAP